MRWWERWPDRLELELELLRHAGIRYEQDPAAFARGVLRLRLWADLEGTEMELVAQFPASYPYLRVEVSAPALRLAHHQHPYRQNLCLFGRDSGEWHPSDTLASVITDRLPLVLAAAQATAPAAAADLEEHQAEPITYYFEYQPGAVMLVDSGWQLQGERGGQLLCVLETGAWPLRGAVAEVRADGRRLSTADSGIVNAFGAGQQSLQARWVRMPQAPGSSDPRAILQELVNERPELSRPVWKQASGELVDVIGIVFPEEVTWRSAGDGWLFLVRYQDRAVRPPQTRVHLVRAGRAGRSDLVPRIPELGGLAAKGVSIAGLGALGAPSAVELAKAGVGKLHLLDFDHVEAGTIPRWALGLQAVGHPKVTALGGFVTGHFPFTSTLVWQHQIGAPDAGDHELELLDRFLDDVDLLFDASAEIGVQQLLSDLARARGIPYVCVTSTHGAWGGLVARIDPDRDSPCWMCLQLALRDRTIPPPPADPSGLVQPAGCASPTFTGAGFELSHVVASGVRTAVGLLVGDGGFSWKPDVTVVVLRDDSGTPVNPQYRTCRLVRHPECRQHAA